MLIRCVCSCGMSSSRRLAHNVFRPLHVCSTPFAERVQVLCKWCATCASGLLHCAATSCTLRSNLPFRSGCAWRTMDPQLQQLLQLLQRLQASGSRSAGVSSRPPKASGSGNQEPTSSGFTTPKKTQVDQQQSNHQLSNPPRLDCNPTSRVTASFWCTIQCNRARKNAIFQLPAC